MPKKISVFLVSLLVAFFSAWADPQEESKVPTIAMEGEAARVVIDVATGGAIVDFSFRDEKLNPFTWEQRNPQSGATLRGHFLCLDRWGLPSEAEEKRGMTGHGEAPWLPWTVTEKAVLKGESIRASMAIDLPIAGLSVQRTLDLALRMPLLVVAETVTNTNRLGRPYNMVQHPTIGPPFLDENTLVDSNARKGLMQDSPLPRPEEPAVYWPQALLDGQPVNLRYLRDNPNPNVVSYAIDEEYGWTTACNPRLGLLVGYLWKTSDYPWLSMWRDVKDGRPAARGLEFGTTGLHQPFRVLLDKGKIFGRSLFAYLDAGEKATRPYAVFLFRVPKDYQGVDRLAYEGGAITLHERGGGERTLTMETGALFGE